MNLSVTAKILLSYHAQRQKVEKPYSEYLEMLASESTVLRKFQPQFASDRISYLTESTFREFLSFKHNQHWTGLQRSTSKVCNDMPKLRKAIAYLFDEDQPIAERVDQLTKNDERSVPGIGVGILTPLLLVGFPDKYGVWNSKAESALKTLAFGLSFRVVHRRD